MPLCLGEVRRGPDEPRDGTDFIVTLSRHFCADFMTTYLLT